jgi:hypothetical protein
VTNVLHYIRQANGSPEPTFEEEEISSMFMNAALRTRHAEAGVLRCFKNHNRGRYAFMARPCAVRHCKEWIKVLRAVRAQALDEIAAA